MQKDNYYTLPIDFPKLKSRKRHSSCDLRNSIAQYIHLITTTYLGEFSIDPDFGCAIWDYDFDNTTTDNVLREGLKKSLVYALEKYEKRIHNIEVSVLIKQTEIGEVANSKRIKKRIDVVIKSVLTATNEPFKYFEHFFLGPLSYY